MSEIRTGRVVISFPATPTALWEYQAAGCRPRAFAPPSVELDGEPVSLAVSGLAPQGQPLRLANGVLEHRLAGPVLGRDGLRLVLVLRERGDCPVVRFRYELHSAAPRRITKAQGRDRLSYLAFSLADLPQATEVRFSEFTHRLYSYLPGEYALEDRHFAAGLTAMGPMIVAGDGRESFLVAYEHGSIYGDPYLLFHLDARRRVCLSAVKGNYYAGQPLDPDHPYETIWFQVAAVPGDGDALAAAYRSFVLTAQCPRLESRKPYIYYNTWMRQCLTQQAGGALRDALRQDPVLREIDIAHRMGVDVFVLDAGWFTRCGDWPVNPEQFPDNLAAVRARLDGYGMKLGLWFSTQAGTTSPVYAAHRDCAMSWRGTEIGIWKVWETEEAQHLCLVSRYVDAFADELIRLTRELGVTYFKWDAFGHYGCDVAHHLHGDASATAEDRGQCYTFLFDRYMQRLADRVTDACPEAIIDFDVTEPHRNFGLGFLASGKYFLMNDPTGMTSGHVKAPIVRDWGARSTLVFDKWIPSVLMLTHYPPDEPADSQRVGIASLVLGHNGIWGDILAISEEGVARYGRLLGLYKQVRDDITESTIVATGNPGGNPEVYEKISDRGRGVVCVFATLGVCADVRGGYTYVTRHPVSREFTATEGVDVTFTDGGHACIRCTFGAPSAKIIFFGVRE